MPQNEDAQEQEQALELTPEIEQPSAALLAFYEDLPGEVVTICEEARTDIFRDTITHLRTVRKALAPYGRFKEWCEAAGFNYKGVQNRLDYLDNSKQRVLKLSTAPLVNPSGVQRIAVHLTHIPPASPPPATEVVNTGIAGSDAVAESYGDDDGDYDWDNPDDASLADISDFMAKSPAQMMAYAFTRFRDICEGKDSNSGHTSYLPVTPEALQAWWRGVDNREWIQALKTLDWFLDATKPYQEFLESHRHRTPPIAQVLAGFVMGNTGVMLAMLADVTPRKRLGMAVGIASAGFPIGSSIGPFFGGLIAQGPGIRALLGIDAGTSALMGIVLTIIVHEEAHKVIKGETVGRMLRVAVHAITSSPVVLRLFGLYFLAMYGYSLVAPFVPILLQHWYTGDPRHLAGTIGTTLTLSGIAMAIMTPIWGRIGDTAGRWLVLPICLAGMVAGLLVAGLAQSLLPVQLDIIGIGLFQGGIGATVIALLALLAPEERRAPILNFSLLPSQLSWFVGPITGAALTRVSLTLPFLVGAGLVTVALAFAVFLAWWARGGHVATAAGAAGAPTVSIP